MKIALLLLVLLGFALSGVAHPAAPAIRTAVRTDVSRAPAGVPIALEVRLTNTSAERRFLVRRRVEPVLQQFVRGTEGIGVEVERAGNGGEVIGNRCGVVTPPSLTESDFMVIDGRRHMVFPIVTIEPGETRVVRLDNVGVCHDLFSAGTYRIAVTTPPVFSQAQLVERSSSYFVTSETAFDAYRNRERKLTEPVLISVTASRGAQSFRDAREALARSETQKALQILETIRAQAISDEVRAAALFWMGIAQEERSQFAAARESYDRVRRAFARTAAGRIAGHRVETLRGKQNLQ